MAFVAGAVEAVADDAADEEDVVGPVAVGFEAGALDGGFPFV